MSGDCTTALQPDIRVKLRLKRRRRKKIHTNLVCLNLNRIGKKKMRHLRGRINKSLKKNNGYSVSSLPSIMKVFLVKTTIFMLIYMFWFLKTIASEFTQLKIHWQPSICHNLADEFATKFYLILCNS